MSFDIAEGRTGYAQHTDAQYDPNLTLHDASLFILFIPKKELYASMIFAVRDILLAFGAELAGKVKFVPNGWNSMEDRKPGVWKPRPRIGGESRTL